MPFRYERLRASIIHLFQPPQIFISWPRQPDRRPQPNLNVDQDEIRNSGSDFLKCGVFFLS